MLWRTHSVSLIAFALVALCCDVRPTQPSVPAAPDAGVAARVAAPLLTLVESTPVETSLDHAAIADTHNVWLAMITGAQRSIDLSQFYVAASGKGRLEPVLVAIEQAAARGVKVRLLADASFAPKYPASLTRLAAAGVTVRQLDLSKTMGGVQHAKYFVVDEQLSYLGSANFDWRALEHIHELGVKVRSRRLAATLTAVFAIDWAIAGGQDRGASSSGPSGLPSAALWEQLDTDTTILPALSPRGWLPDERLWELPMLLAAIGTAKSRIDVQLLSYQSTFRDGRVFNQLDSALRKAAARGVQVRLLLSDWVKRPEQLASLKVLAKDANLTIKMLQFPEHSGGFIPFARVAHAKYALVDSDWSWIGSSNWSGDYFFRSRNVSLVVRSAPFAAQLRSIFEELYGGPYAEMLDPNKEYTPPRIAADE